MYLYTDRVYNHKIDDYINSTSIKQLGGKQLLAVLIIFLPDFNNDNKTFQLNRFKRKTIEDQGAILSYVNCKIYKNKKFKI